MHHITVKYQTNNEQFPIWYELDRIIEAFIESHGFKCLGSGLGFGWRDIEFEKEEE